MAQTNTVPITPGAEELLRAAFRYHDALVSYLRGELTEQEQAALHRLLKEEPDAGRALFEYVNETSLLVRVTSQIEAASATAEAESGSRPGWPAVWKWAALFAMLAAVTALFVFKPPPVSYDAPRLALHGGRVQITRNAETVLASDGLELASGDIVTTGAGAMATIRYRHERTQLSLQSGTILLVEDFAHGKHFGLRQGVIDAKVAPQAAGRAMLIATSHARATVVGTEFKLGANAATTKLDVLEGKVEFTCRISPPQANGFGAMRAATDVFKPKNIRSQKIRKVTASVGTGGWMRAATSGRT